MAVEGRDRWCAPERPLHVGNAGTAARSLAAACEFCDAPVTLDGTAAMRVRPISPLLDALGRIGLRAVSATGFFPVTVGGAFEQRRDAVTIDASLSSQYVSTLLMIAPLLPNGLALAPRDPAASDGFGYIDLTLDLMGRFGADARRETRPDGRVVRWHVPPGGYRGTAVDVEPDASDQRRCSCDGRLRVGRRCQSGSDAKTTRRFAPSASSRVSEQLPRAGTVPDPISGRSA